MRKAVCNWYKGFLFVLIISSLFVNSTIAVNSTTVTRQDPSVNSTIITINDFSDFEIGTSTNGNISITKTDNWIYFKNNNLSETQAYQDVVLSFDSYGNITDVTIEFDIYLEFYNSTTDFIFDSGLFTLFDEHTEVYTNHTDVMTRCALAHYFGYGRLIGELFFGDEESQLYDFLNNSLFNFKLVKSNTHLQLTISNENNEQLFVFTRNDPYVFAYTNGFYLWYSSFQDQQYSVNVTNLKMELVNEIRDWQQSAKESFLIKIILISLAAILFAFLILVMYAKIRQTRSEKIGRVLNEMDEWSKQNKEKRENN